MRKDRGLSSGTRIHDQPIFRRRWWFCFDSVCSHVFKAALLQSPLQAHFPRGWTVSLLTLPLSSIFSLSISSVCAVEMVEVRVSSSCMQSAPSGTQGCCWESNVHFSRIFVKI